MVNCFADDSLVQTRPDHAAIRRTGGAQSTKTYKRWGSAGRKQRWQLLTDTDGVGVWRNVSSWMRDESRSRSTEYYSNTCSSVIISVCQFRNISLM